MRKISNYLMNIRKSFIEIWNSKRTLFFWCFFITIICLYPIIKNKLLIKNVQIENSSILSYIEMLDIFLIVQYILDSSKREFTDGGGIFVLNMRTSWFAYLLGKAIVCLLLVTFLFLSAYHEISEVITMKSIILLLLFYVFVINNTFLFSLLFSTTNSLIISYSISVILPFLIMRIVSIIPKYFERYMFLGILLFILNKCITKAYISNKFRGNLR